MACKPFSLIKAVQVFLDICATHTASSWVYDSDHHLASCCAWPALSIHLGPRYCLGSVSGRAVGHQWHGAVFGGGGVVSILGGCGTVGGSQYFFGAGFGGNGTIVGSTANIVVASLSEKTHAPITSLVWNKRGLPVMLGTCLIASVLYVLLFDFISR